MTLIKLYLYIFVWHSIRVNCLALNKGYMFGTQYINAVLFFCHFSSMQSQQVGGYGAAYRGGYSGSHTGSWATEGPSVPALNVCQVSPAAQGRPQPVTTSTVVSGEQDDSFLDITLSDPVNLPTITSHTDLA